MQRHRQSRVGVGWTPERTACSRQNPSAPRCRAHASCGLLLAAPARGGRRRRHHHRAALRGGRTPPAGERDRPRRRRHRAQRRAHAARAALRSRSASTSRDLFGNNAAAASVDLRGYGVTAPQNTLILLDGRRLNDFDLSNVQWSAIPLSNVERIEILRGTGAVLHGDGASAGVINIVTRDRRSSTGRRSRPTGRVASFDTYEGQLYGSFANDVLGVNATLYGYTSNGYRDNNHNEQKQRDRQPALGAGRRCARPAARRRSPGPAPARRATGAALDRARPVRHDRRGTNTPDDYANRDGNRAAATLTPAHRRCRAADRPRVPRQGPARASRCSAASRSTREDDLELTSVTPRLRLSFATGDAAPSLTVGVDLLSLALRLAAQRPPARTSRGRPTASTSSRTIEAFYVQDLIDLSAGDDRHAGLAYRAARSIRRARHGGSRRAGVLLLRRRAAGAAKRSASTPGNSGCATRSTPSGRLVARAGRSYRFVNAEEIYEFDAFFAPEFQILRPQNALTYEAGVEWQGRALWTRAMLFQSDIHDEIHLDPVSPASATATCRRRAAAGSSSRRAGGRRPPGSSAPPMPTPTRSYLEGVLPGSPFAIGTQPEHRRQARAAGARAQARPVRGLGPGRAHAPVGRAARREQPVHGQRRSRTRSGRKSPPTPWST